MSTDGAEVWTIWTRAGRAVDAIEDALAETLETDEDGLDCTNARQVLTCSLTAAKALRKHLEDSYELDNGGAEVKEGVCLD